MDIHAGALPEPAHCDHESTWLGPRGPAVRSAHSMRRRRIGALPAPEAVALGSNGLLSRGTRSVFAGMTSSAVPGTSSRICLAGGVGRIDAASSCRLGLADTSSAGECEGFGLGSAAAGLLAVFRLAGLRALPGAGGVLATPSVRFSGGGVTTLRRALDTGGLLEAIVWDAGWVSRDGEESVESPVVAFFPDELVGEPRISSAVRQDCLISAARARTRSRRSELSGCSVVLLSAGLTPRTAKRSITRATVASGLRKYSLPRMRTNRPAEPFQQCLPREVLGKIIQGVIFVAVAFDRHALLIVAVYDQVDAQRANRMLRFDAVAGTNQIRYQRAFQMAIQPLPVLSQFAVRSPKATSHGGSGAYAGLPAEDRLQD